MPSLSELNGHHEDLVARVIRYAESLGWRAVPVVYHEAAGGEALKLVGDATGLYVRTLPDLVLTDGKEAILVEVKTGISRYVHNATPELYPIVAARVLHATLGVRILYVYEDTHAGISAAWWAHEVFHDVPVEAILVGSQRHDVTFHLALIRHWKAMGVVPDGVQVVVAKTRGSGDPFIIIPESYLRTLAPWHYVLHDMARKEEV